MRVKCIDNELCTNLTLNKEYNVVEEAEQYYVIHDDEEHEIVTRKTRFEIVQDGELAKKVKATINELSFQASNEFKDIKDFKIRQNIKGEIKEIIIKFKYE